MASDSVAYHGAYQDPVHRTRLANESFHALSPLHVARDTSLVGGYPTPQQPLPADLGWGTSCSTDSTIGLDYRFVLPRHSDLSSGALVELSMYSRTGQAMTGVSLGAIADFDVVTDYAADEGANQGIASANHGYVGVVGGEADTSGNFIPNTNRIALFYVSTGGGCYLPPQGAGQILDNAFYLYPGGKYLADTLYSLMQQFGTPGSWGGSIHVDTGQAYADLSALLVYARNATLGATDTLRWGFGIAASNVSASDLETKIAQLRLAANTDSLSCCYLHGDVNATASVGSADIIYLVNYVFKSGPCPLPCCANGNVNCDAGVTSADIIHLVNYVFKSGEPPCDICHDSPLTCTP